MSISLEQAQDIAQQWLDQYLPGNSAVQESDAFYDYYTIHVLREGQAYGMLNVNGYTGCGITFGTETLSKCKKWRNDYEQG